MLHNTMEQILQEWRICRQKRKKKWFPSMFIGLKRYKAKKKKKKTHN